MEKGKILTYGETFVRIGGYMKIEVIHKILGPIMIAGAIILGIGLYYLVVMAGIPYQDPPLELQIQYAVNSGIGEVLTKMGTAIACVGLVGRAIVRLIMRKKNVQ